MQFLEELLEKSRNFEGNPGHISKRSFVRISAGVPKGTSRGLPGGTLAGILAKYLRGEFYFKKSIRELLKTIAC